MAAVIFRTFWPRMSSSYIIVQTQSPAKNKSLQPLGPTKLQLFPSLSWSLKVKDLFLLLEKKLYLNLVFLYSVTRDFRIPFTNRAGSTKSKSGS